jgi:hypothetical protein
VEGKSTIKSAQEDAMKKVAVAVALLLASIPFSATGQEAKNIYRR